MIDELRATRGASGKHLPFWRRLDVADAGPSKDFQNAAPAGARAPARPLSYAALSSRLRRSTGRRRSCIHDQSDSASVLDHQSCCRLRRPDPGQPGRVAGPADEHQAAQAQAIGPDLVSRDPLAVHDRRDRRACRDAVRRRLPASLGRRYLSSLRQQLQDGLDEHRHHRRMEPGAARPVLLLPSQDRRRPVAQAASVHRCRLAGRPGALVGDGHRRRSDVVLGDAGHGGDPRAGPAGDPSARQRYCQRPGGDAARNEAAGELKGRPGGGPRSRRTRRRRVPSACHLRPAPRCQSASRRRSSKRGRRSHRS